MAVMNWPRSIYGPICFTYRAALDDPEVAPVHFGRVLWQKPPNDAIRVDIEATLQHHLVAGRCYCRLGRSYYIHAEF